MKLPSSITITDSAYWLDGGTTTLQGRTNAGEDCSIQLNQRVFDAYADPGRLLFNGNLVDVRSDKESQILDLLKNATIEIAKSERQAENKISKNALILGDDIKKVLENTPEENLRQFRDEIIAYVESDQYVEIATNGIPSRDR